MNTKGNLASAVLAGISIGAVSVMAVHAQEAKTPPAYLIAETDVTDRAAFQKYAEKVTETLAPFRGSFHYVVRGGKLLARIVPAGDSRMTPVPADAGGRIELDELRKRAGRYFDRVAAGQMIEVIRGGKLVARIVSVGRNDARRSA